MAINELQNELNEQTLTKVLTEKAIELKNSESFVFFQSFNSTLLNKLKIFLKSYIDDILKEKGLLVILTF